MESTGVSWKPVWNVLEKTLRLVLANPHQIKNIPSQKTGTAYGAKIAAKSPRGQDRPAATVSGSQIYWPMV